MPEPSKTKVITNQSISIETFDPEPETVTTALEALGARKHNSKDFYCPFCAELVSQKAVLCKHCKSNITPVTGDSFSLNVSEEVKAAYKAMYVENERMAREFVDAIDTQAWMAAGKPPLKRWQKSGYPNFQKWLSSQPPNYWD